MVYIRIYELLSSPLHLLFRASTKTNVGQLSSSSFSLVPIHTLNGEATAIDDKAPLRSGNPRASIQKVPERLVKNASIRMS